jgi:hypothetical protein
LNLSNNKQIFKDQDCCSQLAGYRKRNNRNKKEAWKIFRTLQNSEFSLQLQWCILPGGKIVISKRNWKMGLFINASKLGLKAVLLQNVKVKPSKSVVHSVAMNKK